MLRVAKVRKAVCPLITGNDFAQSLFSSHSPPPNLDTFDGALLAPFVAFSLHELLKNAMGAHVRRVGGDAGRLDDLPPIDVSVGFHGRFGFVRVVDSGGGFPAGSDARRHGSK